jgi:hypothetical protein
MESTSETQTSNKRRRFSTDNPFCDPDDDTDFSPYDIPHVDNSACLPESLQPANSTNNNSFSQSSRTTQHGTTTDTNQSITSQWLDDITFNGAFDNFSVHANEKETLVKDFKKAMAEFPGGRADLATVGAEEITRTLRDLGPFDNIIYLYVRFAKQQPTCTFNSDSLCSLLCIAKQCNYKPHIFLTKVRSFQVRNNLSSKYGVKFNFVTRNNKDVDGVELTKKFLGLKYTLDHLQSTITKKSVAIKANTMESTISPATKSGGTTTSLYMKQWVGIDHRWLAYHIVDHLFSRNKVFSWTSKQIFVFSIQVFVPCGRARSDFLNPLVGLCLQFKNHAAIDQSKDQLAAIQADSRLFFSFGNTCLRDQSGELQIRSIYQTFSNLNKIIQRKTSYDGFPLESKWLLLQAYTYSLWLELSQNQSTKSRVLSMLHQGESTDISLVYTEEGSSTTSQSVPGDSSSPKKRAPLTPQPPGQNDGGLHFLLKSRPELTMPSQEIASPPIMNNVPQEVFIAPDLFCDTMARSDVAWRNLRLLTTHELNKYFDSFLVIRRDDGVDIVSRLSAMEIYSADNLHKFPHARFNGCGGFFPRMKVGEVVFTIGNQIKEFIDATSKSFHVARESSVFFSRSWEIGPTNQ